MCYLNPFLCGINIFSYSIYIIIIETRHFVDETQRLAHGAKHAVDDLAHSDQVKHATAAVTDALSKGKAITEDLIHQAEAKGKAITNDLIREAQSAGKATDDMLRQAEQKGKAITDSLVREAQEKGKVLTDDLLKQAQAAGRSYEDFNRKVEGKAQEIASDLTKQAQSSGHHVKGDVCTICESDLHVSFHRTYAYPP